MTALRACSDTVARSDTVATGRGPPQMFGRKCHPLRTQSFTCDWKPQFQYQSMEALANSGCLCKFK